MKKIRIEKRRMALGGREIPLLVLRPAQRSSRGPGVLWIHGGGYITGMPEMVFISRALALVRKFGAVVIAPGYRLAGEAPYPAALEDCYAALVYLRDHAQELNVESDQLMVGGESAGGGLVAALCMLARDRGDVSIAFQMPLYPMLDDRDTPSSRDNHGLVWNTRLNHSGWRAYLGALWGKEPPAYAAPARQTDYSGLPPAYTFVGTREPFYCETVEYVEHLRAAGVRAEIDVYETGVHAFDMLLPFLKKSRLAARRFEAHFGEAVRCCRAKQPETGGM